MTQAVDIDHVERSKSIHQRTGPTFHLATRLLPERTRYATYVLYGFFRMADDVVDDPDPTSPAHQRAALERIRREAPRPRRVAVSRRPRGPADTSSRGIDGA